MLLFIVTLALLVSGCKSSNLTRPYGYLRLGPLKNFLAAETVLESEGLLIRHDQGGLYAMSTYCTFDLTPLKLQAPSSGERVFMSAYTASSYFLDGTVKTGPASHRLPYYKLEIDSLEVQGPKDTLYVYIADEVDAKWRLRVG